MPGTGWGLVYRRQVKVPRPASRAVGPGTRSCKTASLTRLGELESVRRSPRRERDWRKTEPPLQQPFGLDLTLPSRLLRVRFE